MPLEAGPNAHTDGQRLNTGIRTPDGRSLLRWHTGDTEYDDLLARLMELGKCAGSTCR